MSCRLPSLILQIGFIGFNSITPRLETQCQIKTSIIRVLKKQQNRFIDAPVIIKIIVIESIFRYTVRAYIERKKRTIYHSRMCTFKRTFIFIFQSEMSRVINKLSTAYQMDGARVPSTCGGGESFKPIVEHSISSQKTRYRGPEKILMPISTFNDVVEMCVLCRN